MRTRAEIVLSRRGQNLANTETLAKANSVLSNLTAKTRSAGQRARLPGAAPMVFGLG